MIQLQFNLKKCWPKIHKSKVELDLPENRWKYNWSCNEASATRLYNAILHLGSRIIVETGTFEGIGTYIMAKAAHENNNQAHILTIDYDDDPSTKLPQEEWFQLRKTREENLNLIRNKFSNVKVTYINGDSRKVLKSLFSQKLDHWGFFYQDSMHFKEGILDEWHVMRQFAGLGSVVVFDDVALSLKNLLSYPLLKSDFCAWFFWHEVTRNGWTFKSIRDGRAQFWAQKIKVK